jgi:hypothetical protein
MHQLATFTTTNPDGHAVLVRAFDGKILAARHPDGATIFPDAGAPYIVSVDVASLQTSISTLWTAYLTALGDPP